MTRTVAWVLGLTGWRRLLFAFVIGAVSAAGFAPLDFFPALLIGYAALVLLIDGAGTREKPLRGAAWAGWAFCFGQFLIGWHWIGYAFLVDPANHLWQMPFALVSLTAGLALYGALACGLAAFSGVTVPAGFWFSPSAGLGRNGCGAIFSQGSRGTFRPMAGARPWNYSNRPA